MTAVIFRLRNFRCSTKQMSDSGADQDTIFRLPYMTAGKGGGGRSSNDCFKMFGRISGVDISKTAN